MEREDMTNMDDILAYRNDASILSIPSLKGFEVTEDENMQSVYMATSNDMMIQIISDGRLGKRETVDDRISDTINMTKMYMREQGLRVSENTFFFYKEFSNGVFDFKVFVQDMEAPQSKQAMRCFVAFFREPKKNVFYQIGLSMAPVNMPFTSLKLGMVDLEHDTLTKDTLSKFEYFLLNLKYKD